LQNDLSLQRVGGNIARSKRAAWRGRIATRVLALACCGMPRVRARVTIASTLRCVLCLRAYIDTAV